ncbi:MAG: ATP-dependent protease ATPase subunit HslU [Candidatus Competibacteraceae bacterium]|nr:ATP-dependent protease ATPase subunit HslU [Candidatus Competibacteraceae bacterium]
MNTPDIISPSSAPVDAAAPDTAPSSEPSAEPSALTPREIVAELDRYIVGQKDAKKAVAIALRNRWRRQQVPEALREEIIPKNILMIGPTGCGKTEIARRLAKLAKAPFIKIEATKFTEVGYVGRDVESIVRDLVDYAIAMQRETHYAQVEERAEQNAENRVLDALVGASASEETRRKFRDMLREGKLAEKEIDVEVADTGNSAMQSFDIPGMPGSQMGMINISEMLGKAFGERMRTKRMRVDESYEVLMREESEKLVDQDRIIDEALDATENHGIVFIDEMDKIAARSDVRGGEVSREGVQRDLLPLLEGTIVNTKYGPVKTDHILFIASGAFHMAKPSDLLPELQGRLPIRVQLKALTEEDMLRILTEPEASLVKQYVALLETEGAEVTFTDEGVKALAELAIRCNREVENIGARRLHTIMEKLMEDASFDAPENKGMQLTIDAAYVRDKVEALAKNTDLSKFVL